MYLFEGEDVSKTPPYRRNVNTVFQHYALFPHMTIFDNVAFGPRSAKLDKKETAKRVGHYKWVEMKTFEVLGGWIPTVPELDVKMRLGTHCYHHAWHADLWNKRLPELREMNVDRLTVPGPGMETAPSIRT